LHINSVFFALICTAACLAGCSKTEDSYHGQGKRPVYTPLSSLNNITNLPPQEIRESGKTVLLDTLFFMVEENTGIHVFDVKDSLHVQSLTFFQIPAVTDFTIAGNRLYADNWKDLVTIDISDLYHIKVLDRQYNVFAPLLFPPKYRGIFECIDESKGAVIGWEDAYLTSARCFTQ
jgi:hypothetical protein